VRVLSTHDLDPSSDAGQVVGGTVAGRSTRGGALSSTAERARARAQARQAATREAAEPDRSQFPQGLHPRSAPPTAGGGGAVFTPRPESTGRLETRLETRPG
jgi:hypothetical protein